MRKVMVIYFVAAVMCLLPMTAMGADPIANWEMEETTGSTAYDTTANSYDLTVAGGLSLSSATTTGKIDNGFVLDGTGERLEHGTLLDTMPTGLTITGWIKPDATGMSSTQCWFSKQNAGTVPGPAEQLWLRLNMSGSTPGVIGVAGRSNGSYFTLNSDVTWVDDTWYHVAFTWDSSGGEIYVDSTSEASNAVAIMGNGTSMEMTIGSGGGTSSPLKGVIDDIRIYDEVLTSTEIGDVYDYAGGGPTTYALTVNSGTGDGSYAESTVVNIAADTPASGYSFDEWTGDTAYVANVNSASTTVTMPAAAVSVTATYVANTYTLTVTNGTGDGSYAASTVVNITADTPASGYVFDAWTGDTAYVADVDDPTTTVTMPAAATSVTATYIANSAPVVDAGDDQFLDPPMNSVAILKGTATDDGLPGTGLTYAWTKVSGPGTVTFSDDDALDTDATITTAGTYVLRLTVDDGSLSDSNDLTVVVHNNGRLTYPIVYTDIPKATADINDFTEVYTVNLATYGIYNDGTHAADTSEGINDMLQAIKTMSPEPNVIVFPAGTYLIDETDPIVFDHEDLIVDLNGATFQMNTNGLDDYHMILIDHGTKNFRLTNGTLKGDRFTHDYETIESTHEHCKSILVESGYNLEFDNLTMMEFPGFNFYSSTGIGEVSTSGQYDYVNNSNLESGGFNSSGVKVTDGTKIRTNTAYALTKYDEDEFEFGQTYGYMGLYLITDRDYQAYFYESDMTFIEKQDCVQYKKVSFPSNAAYVHLEFNQSTVPTGTWAGRLTDMEPPEHVHFHDNWLYRNRCLGQAVCGGQKWIIEDNVYEENGTTINGNAGTAPYTGIDFEDGWDLMQDIVFRNNTFTNNNSDMAVLCGSEMIFENNTFEVAIGFTARCENYVVRNNVMYDSTNSDTKGSVSYGTKTGNLSIHDNSYTNGYMYIDNDVAGKPQIMLEYDEFDNLRMIALLSPGDEFICKNCTIENTRWLVGSLVDTITFEDCTFVGTDRGLYIYEDGADITLTETDCTGTLTKYGDYTSRIQ